MTNTRYFWRAETPPPPSLPILKSVCVGGGGRRGQDSLLVSDGARRLGRQTYETIAEKGVGQQPV